jgi:hypothetical protein
MEKVHTEQFAICTLYKIFDQTKNEMGHRTHIKKEMRCAYKLLVVKCEDRRPGRPTHR